MKVKKAFPFKETASRLKVSFQSFKKMTILVKQKADAAQMKRRKKKMSMQLAMTELQQSFKLRKKTDFTRTVKHARAKQTKYA